MYKSPPCQHRPQCSNFQKCKDRCGVGSQPSAASAAQKADSTLQQDADLPSTKALPANVPPAPRQAGCCGKGTTQYATRHVPQSESPKVHSFVPKADSCTSPSPAADYSASSNTACQAAALTTSAQVNCKGASQQPCAQVDRQQARNGCQRNGPQPSSTPVVIRLERLPEAIQHITIDVRVRV